MPPKLLSPPNAYRATAAERCAWWLACLFLAVFLSCLRLTTTQPFRLTTFEQLVNFQAIEPFQHRVLLPAMAAGIQQFAPIGETLLFGLLEVIAWMLLIGLAYRALVVFEIGRSEPVRRLLAFTVLVPMLLHLVAPDLQMAGAFSADHDLLDVGGWTPRPIFYYVYDLPAAMFTLALVLLMAQLAAQPTARRYAAYLAVFAVATVNRETTVFLLPAFLLVMWPVVGARRCLGLLALQGMVFLAIQLPLTELFADNVNPNARLAHTPYEYHLGYNLEALANPLYTITYLARFSAALYIPLLLWRRFLDRRLAGLLIGFALPLAAVALVVGRIVEQRIFIEIVPLIWLGALQVIAARTSGLGGDKAAEPGPQRDL
ncbi:hypothetical protein SADO_12034 [Salinisphaera dokdonensis CL-ES53]|uniref:Uncharacterized protein n=1 Tax=Salinisphaera dokdonensis CL-ES53 TaxID=1304272 RepID=A0ABV2B280_9GAMM